MTTRELQTALARRGYDPGPIDGIRGRLTVRAIRQFQADNELLVDGIVGKNTLAALGDPVALTGSDPIWYEAARDLLGTREKPGRPSNPEIILWAEDLDIDYAGDDIPWCGLFVAHCVGSTLTDEPLPTTPLMARAWRSFGKQTAPRLGAIMVFWRGSRSGWSGHVGFYAGETVSHYLVLGGNQGDKVSVMRIAKNRLLEARWPSTGAPSGEAGKVFVPADKDSPPISKNEA